MGQLSIFIQHAEIIERGENKMPLNSWGRFKVVAVRRYCFTLF
jgi:hypothetical protein